jgi:hypothetical protein
MRILLFLLALWMASPGHSELFDERARTVVGETPGLSSENAGMTEVAAKGGGTGPTALQARLVDRSVPELELGNRPASLTRAGQTQGPPPAPRWDFIAFEVKAWGEPISSWRLTSRGEGSWTETRKEQGELLGSYTLVWHEIAEDAQLYIALENILAKLPALAPDFNKCANFTPDLAYGTIRLTKGATTTEIAWNSGCMDEGYRAFMDTLKQADMLVAEAGREGRVLREEIMPRI